MVEVGHYSFQYRLLFAIFIFFAVIERIWKTFRSPKSRKNIGGLLTIIPFLGYVAVIIFSTLEYFILQRKVNIGMSLCGLLFFFSGLLIRNVSIQALGENWGMSVSSKDVSRLITGGIYKYIRHPYYLSVLLELFGFSLIANARYSILFIFFFQFPLLLLRIRAEDKGLAVKFGKEFYVYKQTRGALLPFNLLAGFHWISGQERNASSAKAGSLTEETPVQVARLLEKKSGVSPFKPEETSNK